MDPGKVCPYSRLQIVGSYPDGLNMTRPKKNLALRAATWSVVAFVIYAVLCIDDWNHDGVVRDWDGSIWIIDEDLFARTYPFLAGDGSWRLGPTLGNQLSVCSGGPSHPLHR